MTSVQQTRAVQERPIYQSNTVLVGKIMDWQILSLLLLMMWGKKCVVCLPMSLLLLKLFMQRQQSSDTELERCLNNWSKKLGVHHVKEAPVQRGMDGNFVGERNMQRLNGTKTNQWSDPQLWVIKHSYNTYIPEIKSTMVDCNCPVRKKSPVIPTLLVWWST